MQSRPFFDVVPDPEIYELLSWDLPGFTTNAKYLPLSLQGKSVSTRNHHDSPGRKDKRKL